MEDNLKITKYLVEKFILTRTVLNSNLINSQEVSENTELSERKVWAFKYMNKVELCNLSLVFNALSMVINQYLLLNFNKDKTQIFKYKITYLEELQNPNEFGNLIRGLVSFELTEHSELLESE